MILTEVPKKIGEIEKKLNLKLFPMSRVKVIKKQKYIVHLRIKTFMLLLKSGPYFSSKFLTRSWLDKHLLEHVIK